VKKLKIDSSTEEACAGAPAQVERALRARSAVMGQDRPDSIFSQLQRLGVRGQQVNKLDRSLSFIAFK
jgi:hypothetical protein